MLDQGSHGLVGDDVGFDEDLEYLRSSLHFTSQGFQLDGPRPGTSGTWQPTV